MPRYAVTGGAGFIGSHLVDRLLEQGHKVVAVDNLLTGSLNNVGHLKSESNFELIQFDLSQGFPNISEVQGIFHLASPASPKDFVPLSIEILRVGSLGTFHAIEYALEKNAWFLMASTSEVYGDPNVHPQPEDYLGNVNPVGVRGVYDEAKRFSEAITMGYHRKRKLQTSIVRIFNTYGPRMRPNDGRVIPNFISQALKGEAVTIYGNGTQTRSFCYVNDLVSGLMKFLEKKPVSPINLGNSNEISVRKIAELIVGLTSSKSELIEKPLPEGDPRQRCPDLTRAKEILGWMPQTNLEVGLQKTIDYFRAIH